MLVTQNTTGNQVFVYRFFSVYIYL